MPGRGAAPKSERRNKADIPIRGEWQPSAEVGWQHGSIPEPPDGLVAASREAWMIWMHAWFASHWAPEDLPGLRKVIQLYDATERGELHRAAELRMSMDTYGITPKGQQDRRWAPPKSESIPSSEASEVAGDPYQRLRAV
jgi:hypothetical protein